MSDRFQSLPPVVIRGAGDLASGVALRLHRAGFRLLLTEIARPLAVRRSVSFSEAVYEGRFTVEDVSAERASDPAEAVEILEQGRIPVLVDPDLELLKGASAPLAFPVVVDARLLKRKVERLDVDLLLGLGPGFEPGSNCDAVVETMRGHNLGRVYWDRPAAENTGLPDGDPVRVLRAAVNGFLLPRVEIGDVVAKGKKIAGIRQPGAAELSIRAPLNGVVRGMLRPNSPVRPGLKIGDVDPRGDPTYCRTVSDKALAVGGGVLEALLSRRARQALRIPPAGR